MYTFVCTYVCIRCVFAYIHINIIYIYIYIYAYMYIRKGKVNTQSITSQYSDLPSN